MNRSKNASVYGPETKRVKYVPKKLSKLTLTRSPKLQMGFSKLMNFKHRYVQTLQLTQSVGTSVQRFRVNGMFDPDQTGTGHQPYYFDTVKAVYDHYTVVGSTIKWTLQPTGSSFAPNMLITAHINDDVVSSNAQAEQSSGQNRLVGGPGADSTVINQKWSAYEAFGPSPLANNSLQGNSTSDPIESQFFELTVQSLDSVSQTSVDIMAEIVYTAVWAELKDLNQS